MASEPPFEKPGDRLVSVIIPSFNRAELISQTLDSVIRQSYTSWECLVVDDGSTDSTPEVVEEYVKKDPRIKLVSRPSDRIKGANSCRNYGYEISNGQLVKWLDSDDLISSDCLALQVSALATAGDVCFSQTNFFTQQGNGIEFIPDKQWGRLRPAGDDPVWEYFFSGLRWQTGSALWRKQYLGEKPFEEGLRNSQEWLMHLKFLLRSPAMVFVDKNLCHARVHAGSMSNKANKNGAYYYHQIIARAKALQLLEKNARYEKPLASKILRFVLWNHLFVFVKLSPLSGLRAFKYYPSLISYLLKTIR